MLASTKILVNLAGALTVLGFDARAVLSACGVRPENLDAHDDSNSRIPVEVLTRFWDSAIDVTRDAGIGVRLAALAKIDRFGVLGNAARASATLGEALLKTARYLKLWNEATGLSLLVEGDRALVSYRSLSPVPRHYAEGDATMTILLVLSRELTGEDLAPDEARFAHPEPPNSSAYHEMFGASARFDCPTYSLVFPAEILTLRIASRESNPADHTTVTLAEGTFSQRVRDLLATELQGGNPMIENIAAQLHMHPRTLARRLKDEGTSHTELLDSLRRGRAEEYVSASDLDMMEVAFLLGFSDASAFNKAFKRWFGAGPVAFRQQLRRNRRDN
jgi:AraC-like DNA-binding protein